MLRLQTPDANGYFDFASEFLGMEECTETTVFEDGMLIAIQHSHDVSGHDHEGHFLEIYSKEEFGVHKMRMFNKCHGLSAFILVKVDGGFKLQTVLKDHFVGELNAENGKTNTSRSYPGVYNFTWRTGTVIEDETTTNFSGFSVDCGNDKSLTVDAEGGTVELCGGQYSTYTNDNRLTAKKRQIFKIYKLSQPYGITGYVENAKVSIVGPAGNTIETVHTGWSDFYEFTANGDSHYGCSLLNTKYYPETNEIIAGVKYPFAISGKVAKVPVHLCPSGDERYRIAIENDNLEMVDTLNSDGWKKNQNNQWYIFPKYENMTLTYAIQNVGTGKYIKFTAGSRDITLSESPSYFDLGGTSKGLNFWFVLSGNYKYCLYASPEKYIPYYGTPIDAFKVHTFEKSANHNGANFLVPSVSGDELDGVDAIGFVRRYHEDTYFWDAGSVNLVNAPSGMRALFTSSDHEGFGEGTHLLYSAQTGIDVPKTGKVTVEFEYTKGLNGLLILGVDIINQIGEVVAFDYHIGLAANGSYAKSNVYTLANVPMAMGSYHLRYWVCNRTDTDASVGHNLKNTQGAIHVTGADYRVVFSQPLVDGKFAANTTWFRMRLSDGLEKYISAQPAYMDAKNNLMLANNTPPNDYAGLWAVIGDKENGYKFYNRAWGPEYAMKTEGENGDARTYMVPAAEASTYDLVQRDRSKKDYKFYVKLHGTDNNYLNDHGNSRYLATWTDGGLGDPGSVMTFETLNMEVFEANTVALKNKLVANWNPWIGHNKVSDFVNSISNDFAQLMLKRNDFSILNGKVFKFVTKADDEDRRGRVLRVDANNNMAGVVSQGETIDDFLQIVNNGDGTFKLLHLATNKYFQTPSAHTITENAADAAAYSYKVYGDEVQALCFISGNEMMHLGNWGYDYTTTHYNDITAGASRWDVICETDAQELSDLITQAKALYAETQEATYQANVGVPGYANAGSTGALNTTINGGLADKTFADATTALTDAMNGVTEAEQAVFFPTDCYFTITNRTHSLVYAVDSRIDETHNAEFIWTTTTVDPTNPNHLWGFYQDEATGDYYLYNVGKKQFANSKGKGSYGDTWILSNNPVAITMEAMDTPYFHIKGDGKTMSVSEGYVGPVITYYDNGDKGVPMQFNKSTVPVKNELLEELESMGTVEFAPGFYTLKYNNLYLNDTRMGGSGTAGDGRRTLTAMTTDKIDNIFYYTPNKEMVGYKSGYGFTYGYCNTGKPETGYNTFTFETSSEPGKYLIHSATGDSPSGWGDRYLLVGNDNNFTDANAGNKKLAAAWTIEAVDELPVTLNYAGKDLGAYGTLWSPVALNIPDGIKAFYGSVSEDNALVLTEVDGGVIPAEAGVVLWDENATTTYVKSLGINADATVEAPETNKFEGWVFTRVNENKGYYYSLGKMNDHMAFYKYTGANLSGFRARIARQNAQGIQRLSFRFANPTSIEEVISGFQNNAVYDLNGRRVTTPEKGIYIVNGKKVIIK